MSEAAGGVGRDYAVIDADGHVSETAEDLFPYLEPPFAGNQQLRQRMAASLPALDGWNRLATVVQLTQLRGVDHNAIIMNRPPAWLDAAAWLAFLDEAGIRRTVLYPSDLLTFGAVRGTVWAVALARAYNAYLHDRYTRRSDRLDGMALLPVQDGEEAARELERAVRELGLRGGVLMVSGIRRPLGDRMYDPLYAVAQDLDVPLAVHAGGSDYLGFDRYFDKGEVEIKCLSHGVGQMIALVSLMMSGVFERFPRLRMAFLEAGAGWVPWLAQRMDAEWEARGRLQAPETKRPPSEYLAQGNLFFNVEPDELSAEFLALARARLGRDDIFLYASDLPHEPRHEIVAHLAELRARTDLPAETKRAILCGAAQRYYRFA